MNIIAEFDDRSVGLRPSNPKTFELRKAARVVLFDSAGNIALVHSRKEGHHKIPGGGIEPGENPKIAAKREAREEAGCAVRITSELGITIEYRGRQKLLQISYCFLGKVVGKKQAPMFTRSEKENKFILEWMPLQQAIALMERDRPKNYWARFMWLRDITLLKEAQKSIRRTSA